MVRFDSRWIGFLCITAAVCFLPGCSGLGFHGTHWRSLAIPDTYPLGSVNRAHYHTMETNGEAADFIFHRNEFVGSTAELAPYGKDHIVEVAARMRSAPFPVLIERSEHNSDPELDAHRRRIVAQILTDFGVPEADQRTIVSPAYGRGINSREGEYNYYQFLYSGFNNGFGTGFGGANGTGLGGGGFGGGGFGGGSGGGGFGFGR